MNAVRALLIAALLGGLVACNSNDGSNGSAFRNLGKRGDSDLGAANAAPAPP